VFVQNLENVKKARPQISQYPRISAALGQALVAAIQGQKTAQQALDEAADACAGFLAVPA
jgi:multiple sugar transport system substrate-binding protein